MLPTHFDEGIEAAQRLHEKQIECGGTWKLLNAAVEPTKTKETENEDYQGSD